MIGYLDLPSGISGDMFLGCLVDAGWPIEQLRDVLGRLKLPDEWSVEARSVMKGPLRATLVDVRTGHQPPEHHHHDHEHHHHHDHGEHCHHHEHEHKHEPHSHRNLPAIRAMIEAADLPGPVKDRAIAVFTRLAGAEARVHGSSIEAVHFHEVGAVDAIIDIVGTVGGLHALGIDRLYASALPLGHGWVNTDHGKLPLPAPATLELLAAAKAPTRPAPGPGELVTPTGAALVSELACFEQPAMRFERIALGAGQKDLPWPNIARLWLGAATEPAPDRAAGSAPFIVIETNIDDMNPQLYTAVCERLLAAGARDVWLTGVQMKKGRPGVVLSVLADAERERAVAELLLAETTTLGVRVTRVHRHEARREMRTVETRYGPVQVKLKWIGSAVAGAMPEYEDCRRIAESTSTPVRVVYETAVSAAQALLGELRQR